MRSETDAARQIGWRAAPRKVAAAATQISLGVALAAPWPARAKRHPYRDQGCGPDRQPTDLRAQDGRETQHGFYGIGRFDGHRRARPQVAQRNGRDRSQSHRRYATGQNSAAQEDEGDEGHEGHKTRWQPASDRERKGRREATGTEAGG
jgi:hypothetical protein